MTELLTGGPRSSSRRWPGGWSAAAVSAVAHAARTDYQIWTIVQHDGPDHLELRVKVRLHTGTRQIVHLSTFEKSPQ